MTKLPVSNDADVDPPKPSRAFRDVLDVPQARFAKRIPLGKGKDKKWKRAVVFGDTHRPFHDEKAVATVLSLIKDEKPDLVVHLGDLLDCYTISSFLQDPARLSSLQDDIDSGRELLYQISAIVPNADKLLLGGNHEDRLRKVVWDLKGAYRELARLRVFQQTMTWPVLLGLDAIGWDWCDYPKQPVVNRIPKLLLKHGNTVRKWSALSAKNEWEACGRSGISGHTHRLGAFYHKNMNGTHSWFEAGCTCSLSPEWMPQPDWMNACLVVDYSAAWYNISPIYIQGGRAMWQGNEYSSEPK